MTLHDRFELEARRDPERLFQLGAELARAHATKLGVAGVSPASVVLLACPRCGGHVLGLAASERAACAAGCGWKGTTREACE